MAENEITTPGPRQRRQTERLVTKRGRMSCITYTCTTRGARVESNYFDVPAEGYGDGNLTGMRIAAEFMQMAEADGKPGGGIMIDVIQDACKALEEVPDQGLSRMGAAVGFLRTLEHFIVIAAQAKAHEKYIGQMIERNLDCERKADRSKKTAGVDFARRMEIAKAAKALAKRSIATVSQGARHV